MAGQGGTSGARARKTGVLVVLGLLLLGGVPPSSGQTDPPAAASPAAFGVEKIETMWWGSRVTLREISWHPSGDYALIAGGFRGNATNPMSGWTLLVRYDNATGEITNLVNQTGPMLFAVKFHPSGSHALAIGEKDTILRIDSATGAVRNLWAELVQDQTTEGKPPVFFARGLAYRPDGEFAIITGSSLLGYREGLGFWTLEPGDMRYYKAIGIAPDSSYAIVEGGDTDENGHARIGQLWMLGLTKERCERYYPVESPSRCLVKFRLPYGLFEPNRSDPADITFHPVINASFVYGYDDTHGTMMRVRDNGTDYVPEWMAANRKAGKYTHMEFRPGGTRALVTALGDPQLLEFDGLRIRPLMDRERCESMWGHRCPELLNIGWHPSGNYAVVTGLFGVMLKVLPQPFPEIEIRGPKASETIVDRGETTVLVHGNALATEFGARIASVQVRVDEGEWQEATVPGVFNPTTWRYRWNVSQVQPGPHTLTVRAVDTVGHRSPEVSLTVYVALPPPPLEAPVLPDELVDDLGDFVFRWDPVPGARSYEVQDARDANFTNRVTWPVDEPFFESLSRDQGLHYFRVRAVGEPRPTSPWSNVLVANVTEGRAVRDTAPRAEDVDTDAPSVAPDDDVTLPPEGTDDPAPPAPEDGDLPIGTPENGERRLPAAGVAALVALAAALAVIRSERRR